MATFTMELKEVLDIKFNPNPLEVYEQQYKPMTWDGVEYGKLPWVSDYSQIGLGTYPIFDEHYRQILNGKIIDEYFNREIGTETIDNFVFLMRKKMDQIMPYYNNLYATTKLTFDPLSTMDITTSGDTSVNTTETSSADTSQNSDTVAKSRSVTSTTPQTMLQGNEDYASAASDSNSDNTNTATGTQSGTADSDMETKSSNHVSGYQGVASELLIRYRNSIINIDVMILNEIQDCFMLVLGNADGYSNSNYYNYLY